jgi:hypothetical protein
MRGASLEQFERLHHMPSSCSALGNSQKLLAYIQLNEVHSQFIILDLTTLQPVHIAPQKLFVRGGMGLWTCLAH